MSAEIEAHGQLLKRLGVEASPGTPRLNTATGYQHDPAWPLKMAGGESPARQWGEMSGLCLDHGGNIWAFHRGDVPVEIYSPKGDRIKTWGKGSFGRPHQARVDHKGHVWLADAGLHVVREYTVDGQLLRTLGTPGEAGSDQRHFNQPTDVAVSPDGSVYISDGYGNNRVVMFDAEGQFVRTWGKLGAGPGDFNLPHSIALDSAGRVYVADRSNARVQIFDRDGKFQDEWTGLMVPWHIVITKANEIYVCGSTPMRWPALAIPGIPLGIPPKDQIVAVFDHSGRMMRQWAFPLGQKPGEVDWLHAMAVDDQGNLYLGDIKGHRAQRFLIQQHSPNTNIARKPATDPAVKRVSGTSK